MFKYILKIKPLISILIILATILAAVYYLANHKDLITNLTKISPLLVVLILLFI